MHYGCFDEYFTAPRREALLIYAGEIIAGFAMPCPYSQLREMLDHMMAEFTIIPTLRRQGLAFETVQRTQKERDGSWKIKYNEKNAPENALLTKVVVRYRPRKLRYSDAETVLVFR